MKGYHLGEKIQLSFTLIPLLASIMGLVSCESAKESSAQSVQRGGSMTPRYSTNQRAVYAIAELEGLAKTLVNAASLMETEGPTKIALYYFTLGGRQHFLGESICQDLATLMTRCSSDQVELYTRRKLGRVTDEIQRQLSPQFDQSTLVQVGKLSGVDAILSGQIMIQGDSSILLNAQILDVSTSQIVAASKIDIPLKETRTSTSPEEFKSSTRAFAEEIAGSLTKRDEPWRVAIYDVTRGKESLSLGRDIAESIASDLTAFPRVQPLTRSALDQVVKEQSLQTSRLFEEDTRAEIARLMGGNAILVGFCEYFRDFYLVNVQIVDVESAQIHTGAIRLITRRKT